MPLNHFELFGFKPSLEINIAQLQQKYFALQQEFHPDKNKDGAEKSARLNEAYGILRNRFRRFEYLVKLKHPEDVKLEQAFLMEVMDMHEEDNASSKVMAEIEKLYADAALDFADDKFDDMAQKYTKIKYLQNVITNT